MKPVSASKVPIKSVLFLCCLAPMLLWLSMTRPIETKGQRAKSVPERIGDYQRTDSYPITPNIVRLLGTSDVSWASYANSAQEKVQLTVVFHDQNWKSLHPPHLCIRGSDFDIQNTSSVKLSLANEELDVGRIQASNRQYKNDCLFLYAFVGQDFVTDSYPTFYLNHAPRSLFRQSTPGFLVRVDSWALDKDLAAAQKRCETMLVDFLQIGRELIRP